MHTPLSSLSSCGIAELLLASPQPLKLVVQYVHLVPQKEIRSSNLLLIACVETVFTVLSRNVDSNASRKCGLLRNGVVLNGPVLQDLESTGLDRLGRGGEFTLSIAL